MNTEQKINVLIAKGYTVRYVARDTGAIIFEKNEFRVSIHLSSGSVGSWRRF